MPISLELRLGINFVTFAAFSLKSLLLDTHQQFRWCEYPLPMSFRTSHETKNKRMILNADFMRPRPRRA
jgi:hypothetical protein